MSADETVEVGASEEDLARAALDLPYIADLGRAVAKELVLGARSAVVAYEPGNMTRYNLTLVAVSALNRVSVDDRGFRAFSVPFDVAADGSWVADAWGDHGCYVFELLGDSPALDAGYVGHKLGGGTADGVAIGALLSAIWRTAHELRAASEEE